jgi:polyhydroxyalkanoate depolymerase
MFYDAYQAQQDFLAPFRAAADLARSALSDTYAGPVANAWLRGVAAGAELFSRARMTHERPAYDITPVTAGGKSVPVHEEVAVDLPFGNLVHFRKDGPAQPPVLLAAPMAGHFSTLLRGTVQTMLADHDVYITDWKSARDVPLSQGRFGTDDYIDYLVAFLDHIGEGVHAVAVCQPCPSMLSAAALMAENNHPACPRSLTLMAGPVDTRINPTRVNMLATEHPLEWFADNLITSVPCRYPGAFRHVYPGFLQLSAFVSMNLPRHVRAQMDLFGHLVRGEMDKADSNQRFYAEYFSVADLAAEFYLETVQKTFQEHHLARGIATYRGRRIDPAAIRNASLLTVEGERDDICGLGQTMAAHALCASIDPSRKRHHVQPGVGHYGVFSGSRWQTEIYPMIRDTILSAA